MYSLLDAYKAMMRGTMNVPASQEKALEEKGWVRLLIPAANERVEMVRPEVTCLALTRVPGGHQQCLLDKNHKGYHSVSVFVCDVCGHARRLPWAEGNEDAVVCWICLRRGKDEFVGYLDSRRDA